MLVFRICFCVNIHDVGRIELVKLFDAVIKGEKFPPTQPVIKSQFLIEPSSQHHLSVRAKFEPSDAQATQLLLSE